MPKGKPLANLMDNEVVQVLYTCIKHANNTIDFDEVAKELGLKDASTAKGRLARVMKAQEKGGPIATPVNSRYKVTKSKGGGAAKVAKEGRQAKGGAVRADGGGVEDEVEDDDDDGCEAKIEDGMDGEGGIGVKGESEAASVATVEGRESEGVVSAQSGIET